MAKKQEFDTIENVFSTSRIPNTEDVNSPENAGWWKTTFHSTDEEAKNESMFNHAIAFDGTKPVVVRDVQRGTQRLFSSPYFSSSYKQRK